MLSGFEKTPASPAELKSEFAKVTDVLVAFCRENFLFADRFYHGMPVWHLQFARKEGGRAFVEVGALRDNRGVVFRIGGVWYLDEADTGKRYIKRLEPALFYVAGGPLERLKELLARALQAIDAWAPGSWDTVLGPFSASKGRVQQELSGGSDHFPLRR